MTSTVFRYELLIREHHLDTFGHVNNAVYLQLFEEARWELLNAQGVNMQVIHSTGIGPVVLECHVQFLKELRLRQSIVIESSLKSYERKVGVMQQDILNAQGELCTHAKMTFGVFDLKARKLIVPTGQWLWVTGGNATSV